MNSFDSQILKKYLTNCTSYLEWGSGKSTVIASEADLKYCISVESDKQYMEDIRKKVKDHITFHYVDLGTEHKTWGYPSKDCSLEAKQAYSSQLSQQATEHGKYFDLVFIDGRFRVACCLKSFSYLSENSIILFDDFRGRGYYHDVLKYYNILEAGEQMYALTKKSVQPPSLEEIEKFEIDAR